MDSFSIFIIILVAVAAGFGWYKGFLKQAAQVAGLILGIAACRIFGSRLATALCGGEPSGADTVLYYVMAYVVLFLVVYVLVSLCSRLLKGVLNTLKVGVLNRIGGAIFNVCKWMLLVSLLLNMWVAVSPSTQLKDSKTFSYTLGFGPWLLGTQTAAQIGHAFDKAIHG